MSVAGRILVCDDEELVRWSLAEGLRSQGFEVLEASNGKICLDMFEEYSPAALLIDVRMPEMDGLTCLRKLRERGHTTPVLMLTALSDIETAVEAIRLGAVRYLTKPFELTDVYAAVRNALERERLLTPVGGPGRQAYGGLIGQSGPMMRVFDTIEKLRTVSLPNVLLHGESGTGKDLIARAIHDTGKRAQGPYVEVDCTAIPEALLESTLFGHERGAFTDAKAQHRGLFELAANGVVFLDEIGELPASMQAKLLRALENRRFKRVGGSVDINFEAAVIAATHRDLKAEVAAGRFREDLYYRLAVVQVTVPPLRVRGEDIRLLVEHFVTSFNRTFERHIEGVTAAAMEKLLQYRWAGNVRELRNVMECAMIFNSGNRIDLSDLPPSVRYAAAEQNADCPFILPPDGVDLDLVEKGLVIQALERTAHNYAAAARLLGISRYALRNRVKKFGLSEDDGSAARDAASE